VQLPDSHAFVGVAVTGTQVVAYACDGTETAIGIDEWFKGPGGDSFTLSSASGASLSAARAGDQLQGTLTLGDGRTFTFRAPAIVDANAGLFRADATFDGVAYVAGWIILPDGEQRGGLHGGQLAFTPIPIPRLPRSLVVETSLGTFTAVRIGAAAMVAAAGGVPG
jgi:hypothetical protein